MLNLDTHIVIHLLNDDLTAREKTLLHKETWSISAIVLWEITKLVELRRVELDLDDPAFQGLLNTLQIWPITLDICRSIHQLDFHSDPADEIIAATSLVHRVPLLTRDRKILRSRCVPLAM